jgi:thiosulfate/3-mercaptopyruvate sulfurtransferase
VVVSTGKDVTDFGAAARVYWTLKVLGLKELSVLNGGVAAWTAAGLPLDNAKVTVAASTFEPRIDESLVASREQTIAAASSGSAKLVDARPPEFFKGETRHQAAKLPGTLKGAVNVEHASWFKPGTTTFVTADEARRIAATTPLDPGRDTISFCNTGHWAATNWFAMSEVLGQNNVKLYAGSMVDWTQAPDALPMDNVPNRLAQLVIDWKLWMDRTFNRRSDAQVSHCGARGRVSVRARVARVGAPGGAVRDRRRNGRRARRRALRLHHRLAQLGGRP